MRGVPRYGSREEEAIGGGGGAPLLKGGDGGGTTTKSEHQAPEEFLPVYTVQRMYLLKLHVCRYFS